MALTIQQAISAVQRRLPDAPASVLLQHANTVHKMILVRIPELRRDTVTLSLTSGTREYSIAETVYQVNSAVYQTAASVYSALIPTTPEELDSTTPTWRTDASAAPQYFYLSTNQASGNSEVIGFYPTPNTTTSAGYPSVLMYTSSLQASDLATTDSCLPTLFSSQVYVEGITWLACLEIRPQMANAYHSSFQSELEAELEYVRTRNEGAKTPAQQNIRGGGYQERKERGNR